MARQVTSHPELVAQTPYLMGVAKNLADKLYGAHGPPAGTTFADLEELAVQLGRTLACELLTRALQRQAAAPAADGDERCPTCHAPGRPAEPEPRLVTTRVGDAVWDEPQRYCDRCRRSFFPAVASSRDRPLRPLAGGVGQDDLCGHEARLVRGGP